MANKKDKSDPLSNVMRRELIEQLIGIADQLNWAIGVPMDTKSRGLVMGVEKFVIDLIQGDLEGNFAYYTPSEESADKPAIKKKPNEDLN